MRLEHWTSAAEQGGARRPQRRRPGRREALRDRPLLLVGLVRQPRPVRRDRRAGDVDVEVVAGDDAEGGPFTALYRAGDRIVGALAVDMRAEVMKYRRLIAKRASWADALELAESAGSRRPRRGRETAEGSSRPPTRREPTA